MQWSKKFMACKWTSHIACHIHTIVWTHKGHFRIYLWAHWSTSSLWMSVLRIPWPVYVFLGSPYKHTIVKVT